MLSLQKFSQGNFYLIPLTVFHPLPLQEQISSSSRLPELHDGTNISGKETRNFVRNYET